MNKTELLNLAGKGYVDINGKQVEVTISKALDSDYIHITQKAINPYTTDHDFSGGWIEFIEDKDVKELEAAFDKVHEKMLKQAEICKQSPLILSTISGSDYLKSATGIKYIVQRPASDHFEICVLSNGEADYAINRPVTIDGKLYLPLWSWWLDKGCYMTNQSYAE
jgi:hypothetical protein